MIWVAVSVSGVTVPLRVAIVGTERAGAAGGGGFDEGVGEGDEGDGDGQVAGGRDDEASDDADGEASADGDDAGDAKRADEAHDEGVAVGEDDGESAGDGDADGGHGLGVGPDSARTDMETARKTIVPAETRALAVLALPIVLLPGIDQPRTRKGVCNPGDRPVAKQDSPQ